MLESFRRPSIGTAVLMGCVCFWNNVCHSVRDGRERERTGELEEEEGGAGAQTAPPDALPDDEEIERREEHYQRLRRTIGVGTEDDESENAPLGFDPATLDEVQTLWDPLTAGELLARVGHFLRIVSQMMEEVGYMAEILSRGHLSAGDRRRSSGGGMETGGGDEEDTVEMLSSPIGSTDHDKAHHKTRPSAEGGEPHGGGLGHHESGGKMSSLEDN